MPYNLKSPNGILEGCTLNDLDGWFDRELVQVPTLSERTLLSSVTGDLETFVRWPESPCCCGPSATGSRNLVAATVLLVSRSHPRHGPRSEGHPGHTPKWPRNRILCTSGRQTPQSVREFECVVNPPFVLRKVPLPRWAKHDARRQGSG